jgi:hypothetical protein
LGLGSAATSASSAFEAAGAVSTHASVTSGVHGISAFGASLIDDADAATARTTLGLGGAATLSVGTTAGTVCAGDDSRLTNSRTPTAHATSHQSGGGDAIKLDDLATPDDNTDLNATTGRHGLLPKLGGGTTNFLRADGTWAAPSGWSPVPTSVRVVDNAFGALVSSDSGTLIELDTTSGNAYLTIQPQSSESYSSGMHFWVRKTASSNVADVDLDSGVDLFNNSLSSGVLSLSAGVIYHIWRRAENVWVVLSAS